MARQLRIQYENAWYHVMHRGGARRQIFLCDDDRWAFLAQLGESYQRYNLEIHAYCLMDNHYHLLIRTPDGNLSDGMRHLNSGFSQKANFRHGLDGHLFRGRYRSQVISDDSYLLTAWRYVHLNPVAAGITSGFENHRWSSAAAYLGNVNPPIWLQRDFLLRRFDRSREEIVAFTNPTDDEHRFGFPTSLIVSDEDFSSELLATRTPDSETQASYQSSKHRPTLDEIDAQAVRILAAVSIELRRGKSGSPNLKRLAALFVADEMTLHTQAELARRYGFTGYKSVASALRRSKRLIASGDETFMTMVSDLRESLRQRKRSGTKSEKRDLTPRRVA